MLPPNNMRQGISGMYLNPLASKIPIDSEVIQLIRQLRSRQTAVAQFTAANEAHGAKLSLLPGSGFAY